MNSEEESSENLIDIDNATRCFYSMIEVEYYVKAAGDEKKLKEFKRIQKNFNRQFAKALYDYLTAAIAGELRHIAMGKVRKYDKNGNLSDEIYALTPWGTNCKRNDVYQDVNQYSSESILLVAKEWFDTKAYYWLGGFGGSSWYDITLTAMKYGTVSDTMFIDMVVHIRHNGGIMFDRELIFITETSDYREWLNWRRTAEPNDWKIFNLPNELYGVLLKQDERDFTKKSDWTTLSLFPYDKSKKIRWHKCTEILFYEPTIWGFIDLGAKIKTNPSAILLEESKLPEEPVVKDPKHIEIEGFIACKTIPPALKTKMCSLISKTHLYEDEECYSNGKWFILKSQMPNDLKNYIAFLKAERNCHVIPLKHLFLSKLHGYDENSYCLAIFAGCYLNKKNNEKLVFFTCGTHLMAINAYYYSYILKHFPHTRWYGTPGILKVVTTFSEKIIAVITSKEIEIGERKNKK